MLSNIKAWRARRLSSSTAATTTAYAPDSYLSAKCFCGTVEFRDSQQRHVNIDKVFTNIIDRDNSWLDIRNPMMEEQAYPSSSGTQAPILLPNEVILQKFPSKKTMHRLSPWKLQNIKLRCKKCSHDKEVITKLVMAGLTLGSQPFGAALQNGRTKRTPEELTNTLLHEDVHYTLVQGARIGTLYVTSQRLIFVPKIPTAQGFSLPYKKLTSMKSIKATREFGEEAKWYFVCYWGLFMTPIEFSTKAQSEAFLKMCSNVQFEHTVSQHLPPPYYIRGSVNEDSCDEWSHEDNRLPSYMESEEALILHLKALGFWNCAHTSSCMSASSNSEEIRRNGTSTSHGREIEASSETLGRVLLQESRDGNVYTNNDAVIYANNSAASNTGSGPSPTLNAVATIITTIERQDSYSANGNITDQQPSGTFSDSDIQPRHSGLIIPAAHEALREDRHCRYLGQPDSERSVRSATQQMTASMRSNATREEPTSVSAPSDSNRMRAENNSALPSGVERGADQNRFLQRSLLICKLISAACQPLRDATDDDDPRMQTHVQELLQSLNFTEIERARAHKLLEYFDQFNNKTYSGSLKRDYLFPL